MKQDLLEQEKWLKHLFLLPVPCPHLTESYSQHFTVTFHWHSSLPAPVRLCLIKSYPTCCYGVGHSTTKVYHMLSPWTCYMSVTTTISLFIIDFHSDKRNSLSYFAALHDESNSITPSWIVPPNSGLAAVRNNEKLVQSASTLAGIIGAKYISLPVL